MYVRIKRKVFSLHLITQVLFIHLCHLIWLITVVDSKIDLTKNNGQGREDIVFSVVSGSAALPCNITPPEGGNDAARLILWYKDTDPQPVYSFDNRYGNHV